MRKQPLDFRQDEISQIMHYWQASESCAVIGVGSVGKSNLLHHVSNPEVQTHYWKDAASSTFKAINIDPNMLGPFLSEPGTSDAERIWGGYELMMHRLFLTFHPFEILTEDEARQFYATYQALQDGSNPLYAYMGLRYFELGLEFFFRRSIQIVFMFDEFEELMRQMPMKFFQTLRGLRDQHKHLLSYTVFARSPIQEIAHTLGVNAAEFESFRELFHDHLVFLGPYPASDARRMLQSLCTSHNSTLPESLIHSLIVTTGGFAGLLRATFHVTQHHTDYFQALEENALLARLLGQPSVGMECETLWQSLSRAEQDILLAVSHVMPYNVEPATESAVRTLLRKKLIVFNRNHNRLEVSPPLFARHLKSSRLASHHE